MFWNSIVRSFVFAAVVVLANFSATVGAEDIPSTFKPNVVLIYCDDLGYGDLGCYGAKGWKTPRLDKMAGEGVRLTNFCTAAAVCSASRAALLTGCYPQRVGILGALGPKSKNGINEDETLISEILLQRGYSTACFGKWHLGHLPKFSPLKHGFQRYYGLPYSNDMWPKHPEDPNYPPLPLIDQDQVAETNPDQSKLTGAYTNRAVEFIRENKAKPFFVYLAHSMPHVPLFASEDFVGKSEQGLYGDVIQEIDDSVGRILDTLAECGLDERTIVIFSSDNGPWLSYGNHAGSSGGLREGKGTTWEGGMRVPCLVRWPTRIPQGQTVEALMSTMDLAPTIARVAGGSMPRDKIIDGHDVMPVLVGQSTESPWKVFNYYWDYQLEAVRMENWKLHFPHSYRALTGKPGKDGKPNGYTQRNTKVALYNLESDPGEKVDVAADHPDVVAQLMQLAEESRADLGDSLTKKPGKNRRPAGMAE